VLIDLKTGTLTPQDVGQMDLYVRLYDKQHRVLNDNSTIDIILCSETDRTVIGYSVLADNNQLFASQYKLYLPTEDEINRLLNS
jgi:hypothetical protein